MGFYCILFFGVFLFGLGYARLAALLFAELNGSNSQHLPLKSVIRKIGVAQPGLRLEEGRMSFRARSVSLESQSWSQKG